MAEICLTFSIQVLGQARWSRNSLPRCKTRLTYKFRVRGLLEMLLRFRHCHSVTPAGGTGRSESLFLQQLRIAVPPCISDHSALVYRMLVLLSSVNLYSIYSVELPVTCFIRQIYIYFMFIVRAEWTSPLNSFPSPTPLYLTSRAGRQATVHGRDLRPSSTTSYHLHPLRQHDTTLHNHPSTNRPCLNVSRVNHRTVHEPYQNNTQKRTT